MGSTDILIKASDFYRQADCALEAGEIKDFFNLDQITKALIVAIVETRRTLNYVTGPSEGGDNDD